MVKVFVKYEVNTERSKYNSTSLLDFDDIYQVTMSAIRERIFKVTNGSILDVDIIYDSSATFDTKSMVEKILGVQKDIISMDRKIESMAANFYSNLIMRDFSIKGNAKETMENASDIKIFAYELAREFYREEEVL